MLWGKEHGLIYQATLVFYKRTANFAVEVPKRSQTALCAAKISQFTSGANHGNGYG